MKVHFMHTNWSVTLCGRYVYDAVVNEIRTSQFARRVTCAVCQRRLQA